MRFCAICIILIFCFSVSVFGQKYETSFYGEEKFKNPIRIPNKILKVLKQNKEVKRCSYPNSQTEFSRDWFEATYVNLNNDSLPDLLVKAKDEYNCINGNAISFWIFKKERNGYRLVLYLYTLAVNISKKKFQRHYKISANRSMGNTTYTRFYAFNSRKYIERGRIETPINY
jgi:hypothetical protein